MRFKLSQADKDYLHSISRNKGFDVRAGLLEHGIGEIPSTISCKAQTM